MIAGHHHHHIVLLAWISLTLSHPSSLLSIAPGRFSRPYPMSAQSHCRYVLAGRSTPAHSCERVHRRMLVMSSSLLLQQFPTCLVCLIWMVLEMVGRWPYSCCFMGCCFLDLFNIVCSILKQLPSRIFSIHLVSVHVVHPYSSMDMTTARKKIAFHFIR